MTTGKKFVAEVHQVVAPHRSDPHGLLPPLLVALTVVTGLIDAFSYLMLGHVFVANMTGNVVFLGFAVAGASGFSIPASLVALGSFAAGALVGGIIASRHADRRSRLLAAATSLQAVLLGVSIVVAAVEGDPIGGGYRYVLIVLLGGAMGIQNAAARKLAVPDLTTTVLTLTITGVAADSGIAGGAGSVAGRRLVAITAMFLGALLGAALLLHVHIVVPLVIALAVTAVVAGTSWALAA